MALLERDDRAGVCAVAVPRAELADRVTSRPAGRSTFFCGRTAIPKSHRFLLHSAAWSKRKRSRKRRTSELAGSRRASSCLRRLREDESIATKIDRLLDPSLLPWFLRRSGATAGWLPGDMRQELAGELTRLGSRLSPTKSTILPPRSNRSKATFCSTMGLARHVAV